ncbi:MAG: alpha/beta hydrolase [Flavobacteriaceae bacterium]
MVTKKKHIYFMPGLGASSKIFEHLRLNTEKYSFHYLEWLIPNDKSEDILAYATRLSQEITAPNPVLIGVSFGGIMVQEIARILKTDKVIIISSVKSPAELPKGMQIAKATGIYKLFPSAYFKNLGGFAKEYLGKKVRKRVELYEKYQNILDPLYLDWSFKTLLNWQKNYTTLNLYHIHGEADKIFPVKYISNYIPVKNGTHIMILNKAKEISKILQEII